MNRRSMFRAIAVMGANAELDDSGVMAALREAGFGERDAELLVAFLPSAFAQPILERLGATGVESVSALSASGEWVQVPLSVIPIYQQTLSIARGQFGGGRIDPGHFGRIAKRSAELNTASQALHTGASVKNATFATAVVGLTAEDLGYGSWWYRIRCRFAHYRRAGAR